MPTSEPIEVAFTLTPKEPAGYQRQILLRSRRFKILLLAFAMIIVGFLLMGEPAASGGAFVGSLAFLLLALTWVPHRNCRRNKVLLKEMRFLISGEGFRTTTTLSKSEIKWELLSKLQETPTAFLLLVGDTAGFIVPKRAFRDASEVERFRSVLASNVGKPG